MKQTKAKELNIIRAELPYYEFDIDGNLIYYEYLTRTEIDLFGVKRTNNISEEYENHYIGGRLYEYDDFNNPTYTEDIHNNWRRVEYTKGFRLNDDLFRTIANIVKFEDSKGNYWDISMGFDNPYVKVDTGFNTLGFI